MHAVEVEREKDYPPGGHIELVVFYYEEKDSIGLVQDNTRYLCCNRMLNHEGECDPPGTLIFEKINQYIAYEYIPFYDEARPNITFTKATYKHRFSICTQL